MRSVSKCALVVVAVLAFSASAAAQAPGSSAPIQAVDHRVLATNKTSTMEKELNEAAEAGFRFQAVMGGDSAFGGKEVVAVMSRAGAGRGRYAYKLLATTKTSTMQKELQEASDAGFQYRGQTVFGSTFGGDQVVVILERDQDATASRYEYRLLATSKTSTLEKELAAAGESGFEVVGMTVSKTAIGGNELVVITRRPTVSRAGWRQGSSTGHVRAR
jgi:hypothetical protein